MIPLFTVNMPKSVDKPLLEVLHSGYITQGPKVEEFEKQLAEYFQSNALTVNSGTSALTLALRLAGVGYGTEVITTPMTCSATNLPILSLEAKPVFADVDPETGLINPQSVEAHVTKQTRAIMAVDWGGSPVKMQQLKEIADVYKLKLIVDSAHSFGAKHTINPNADFTCFSLQAIKHITTVDGGVVLCRNAEDFERGKRLRWFGISREEGKLDSRINEDIEEWGYKFHMNDVAATIGIEQLKYLSGIMGTHQRIADFYDNGINKFYGKPPKGGAYWLYTLRLPNKELRDKFKSHMIREGVQVSQVHRRNDEYAVFQPWAIEDLPGVTKFSETMVCIPTHNKLSAVEMFKIIELCNYFAEQNK